MDGSDAGVEPLEIRLLMAASDKSPDEVRSMKERLQRNLSSEVPALLSGMDDASTVHAFKQAVSTHARTSLPHGWALRNVEVRGTIRTKRLSRDTRFADVQQEWSTGPRAHKSCKLLIVHGFDTYERYAAKTRAVFQDLSSSSVGEPNLTLYRTMVQPPAPRVVVDAFVTLTPSRATLDIYVKTITGKALRFLVRPQDSVADLKARIHDKEGVPPDQLRLFSCGRVGVREELLVDARLLADCDLCNEAVLHMVKRVVKKRPLPVVETHDDETAVCVRWANQTGEANVPETLVVMSLASTVAELIRQLDQQAPTVKAGGSGAAAAAAEEAKAKKAQSVAMSALQRAVQQMQRPGAGWEEQRASARDAVEQAIRAAEPHRERSPALAEMVQSARAALQHARSAAAAAAAAAVLSASTAAAAAAEEEEDRRAAELAASRTNAERQAAEAAAAVDKMRREREEAEKAAQQLWVATAAAADDVSRLQVEQERAAELVQQISIRKALAAAAVVRLGAEEEAAQVDVDRVRGLRCAAEADVTRLQAQQAHADAVAAQCLADEEEAAEAAEAVAAVAERLRLEEEAAYYTLRLQLVQSQLGGGGGGGGGGPPAVEAASTSAPPASAHAELCVVCVDARKDRAMMPCGHMCACEACAAELLKMAPPRCPICRQDIRGVMRVFT